MKKYAPLYKALAEISPNLMIPNSKLRIAIYKENEEALPRIVCWGALLGYLFAVFICVSRRIDARGRLWELVMHVHLARYFGTTYLGDFCFNVSHHVILILHVLQVMFDLI